jgi:eukaryotic-like serine/threonine-protein kinase
MTQRTNASDARDETARSEILGRFLEEIEQSDEPNEVVRRFVEVHPQWATDFAEEAALSRMLSRSESTALPSGLDGLPDFRIVRWVATGGMGIVYEAEQLSLRRRVALKIRHGRPTPDRHERFVREQQALARLHQSHIVPIHVAGQCGAWQYFAMAYIRGVPLHRLVRSALDRIREAPARLMPTLPELGRRLLDTSPSPLSNDSETMSPPGGGNTPSGRAERAVAESDLAESVRPFALSMPYFRSVAVILADAAEAVDFAHGADVVHRDIKPSNILLDAAGHCWLIDFGLAHCAGSEGHVEGLAEITAGRALTRGPMGTPEYMAPEQHQYGAAGETTNDLRSDVWGLGATLYELLSLRRPYAGATYAEIRRKVLNEEPSALRRLVSNVPADLEAICRKALAKDPKDRYGRAADLAADLRRWLRGEPTSVRPAHPVRAVAMWARRNKGWATAVAAALLVFLVTSAAAVLYADAQARQAKLRADAAEESERQERWKTRLQERESFIHAVQRMQLVDVENGWSEKSWDLIRQASEVHRDERLRDLAAATLLRLDARLNKRFPIAASSVAYDASGSRLLVGSIDEASGRPTRPTFVWDGSSAAESSLAKSGPVAFASNGRSLQLVREGETLTLWDVGESKPIRKIDSTGPIESFALAPDGTRIAAALAGAERTKVWDAASGAVLLDVDGGGDSLAFSGDAALLAVAKDGSRRVRVWSIVGGQEIAQVPIGNLPARSLAFGVNLHRTLDAEPGHRGRYLAVGDAGGTVTVFDLSSKHPIAYCRGSPRDIFALAFNPDGTLLASGGREECRLWDVATGRQVLRIRDPKGMDYMTGIAFRPDGRGLAVSTRGSTYPPAVTVWDLVADRGQWRLAGLSGQIQIVSLSPDGRFVAALAQNWEVGLWDLQTGRLLCALEVPIGAFADNAGLAFSDDGKHLAFSVGTPQGTEVRLWDVDSTRELRRWHLPQGLQNKLAFDGSDRLWHIQVETTDGAAFLLGDFPWQRHPRVCRVRDLKADDATRVVTEIADFERHVYLVQVTRDGKHFAIEGLGGPEGDRRHAKMFETSTGRPTWSYESPQTNRFADFMFEPSGKALQFAATNESRSERLSVPNGERLGGWKWVPAAVNDGGSCCALRVRGRTFGCYLCVDGGADPAVNLALDNAAIGIAIDATGKRLVWGGRDGTVVVCDIPRIRARLNQVQLGW